MLDLKAAIVAVKLQGFFPLGKQAEEESCWYTNPLANRLRGAGTCRGPLAIYTDDFNYIFLCAKHAPLLEKEWEVYA